MADIDTHESDETLDSLTQPDDPRLSDKEVLRRWRIGNLLTVQSIAVENAKVYKELRKERLEPSLASRLTQILINPRRRPAEMRSPSIMLARMRTGTQI